MEDMSIILYLVESTGILTELDRVKLSVTLTGKKGAITWTAATLAIITGGYIRVRQRNVKELHKFHHFFNN